VAKVGRKKCERAKRTKEKRKKELYKGGKHNKAKG